MLYISNPSKQNVTIHYRLSDQEPREKGPVTVSIPSGQQISLGNSWTEKQKAYVIKQLEVHGARDAAEAHGAMRRFMGVIYRDGGEVSEDEIVMAHDQIVDTQKRRSATEAMRAVAAFDRTANAKGKGRQRIAKVTEMSIREVVDPKDRSGKDTINFSMSIDPEGRSDMTTPY